MPRYAIILIAGSGRRWGLGDKCLLKIDDMPVAAYSLRAFVLSRLFDRYFFVYRDDDQKNQLSEYIEKRFEDRSKIFWIPEKLAIGLRLNMISKNRRLRKYSINRTT